MKKTMVGLIGFLMIASVMPIGTEAGTVIANQDLQRALNELSAAKIYIEQAQQEEPSHERVVFHYRWVMDDINKVQGGIEQKFDLPRVQPRVISPVSGDYLTMVGEGSAP